jgi:hypothetical protein
VLVEELLLAGMQVRVLDVVIYERCGTDNEVEGSRKECG